MPIIAGAIPDGATLAARSMRVEAYADRSASPRAATAISSQAASHSACISRTVHQAAGLNQWSVRAARSSQFVQRSPRTRWASSCASTCRILSLEASATIDSGTMTRGLQVSRDAGADRFRRDQQVGTLPESDLPTCRLQHLQHGGIRHGTAGREASRSTRAAPSNCSPKRRQPASQAIDRIRTIVGARLGRSIDGPGSGVRSAGEDGEIAGAPAAVAGGLATRSTSRGDGTTVAGRSVSGGAARSAALASGAASGRPRARPSSVRLALRDQADEIERAPGARRDRHHQQPEDDEAPEDMPPPRREAFPKDPHHEQDHDRQDRRLPGGPPDRRSGGFEQRRHFCFSPDFAFWASNRRSCFDLVPVERGFRDEVHEQGLDVAAEGLPQERAALLPDALAARDRRPVDISRPVDLVLECPFLDEARQQGADRAVVPVVRRAQPLDDVGRRAGAGLPDRLHDVPLRVRNRRRLRHRLASLVYICGQF